MGLTSKAEISVGCQSVELIPSHSIVVYHAYTWEHYNQYNNNNRIKTDTLEIFTQKFTERKLNTAKNVFKQNLDKFEILMI